MGFGSTLGGLIGAGVGGGLGLGPAGAIAGGAAGSQIGGNSGAWSGLKNWLFGGNATQGLDSRGAHYDQLSNYLSGQLGSIGNRQAPQTQAYQLGRAAQLDGSMQGDARGQMQGVANRLGAIATGDQAGAGELAVNRQIGQAQAAQQALARSARGANAALAARQAARTSADLGVAGAGQAHIAQLNDQASANQQLAGLLGGMRSQDIDFAGQNANLLQQRDLLQGQFGQQANLANQAAQLQQMGLNDAQSSRVLAALMGLDQQTFANEMAKRGMQMSDKGMFPALLQLGGQLGAAYATGGASGAAAPMMAAAPTPQPQATTNGLPYESWNPWAA